ncbi:hypothetical protein [Burkholderia phage FLC9]|nr:hypothetical protein [Burkholderia phage FLC9]
MRRQQAEYLLAIINIFNRVRANESLLVAIKKIFDHYDSQPQDTHIGAYRGLELIAGRIRLFSLIHNHREIGFPELQKHSQFLEELWDDMNEVVDDRFLAIMVDTDDEWIISRAALKILLSSQIGFVLDNDPFVVTEVGEELLHVDYYCDEFAL